MTQMLQLLKDPEQEVGEITLRRSVFVQEIDPTVFIIITIIIIIHVV